MSIWDTRRSSQFHLPPISALSLNQLRCSLVSLITSMKYNRISQIRAGESSGLRIRPDLRVSIYYFPNLANASKLTGIWFQWSNSKTFLATPLRDLGNLRANCISSSLWLTDRISLSIWDTRRSSQFHLPPISALSLNQLRCSLVSLITSMKYNRISQIRAGESSGLRIRPDLRVSIYYFPNLANASKLLNWNLISMIKTTPKRRFLAWPLYEIWEISALEHTTIRFMCYLKPTTYLKILKKYCMVYPPWRRHLAALPTHPLHPHGLSTTLHPWNCDHWTTYYSPHLTTTQYYLYQTVSCLLLSSCFGELSLSEFLLQTFPVLCSCMIPR